MDAFGTIEFVYDMSLYRLKVHEGLKNMNFILYQEGSLIYKDRIPLRIWKEQHFTHHMYINMDNKDFAIIFIVGLTEAQSVAYSLQINGTLVAGEEPQRLRELTKDAETELPYQASPWALSLTYMSPLLILIITDLINQNQREFFDYFKLEIIGAMSIVATEFASRFLNKGGKALRAGRPLGRESS
ncbi:hypothetical protein [Gracilinema caldarium]|uniref:hypothetical protein n=1 Tax=Gracilinema caldarium TaxID=215591 RepID=UPI0026ECE1B7|nr:hypothetical protein [Gracilinema caldarium]